MRINIHGRKRDTKTSMFRHWNDFNGFENVLFAFFKALNQRKMAKQSVAESY